MGDDTIKFTVLEDGTIKMETDQIGAANHLSADTLIRRASELAGGTTTTKRKGHGAHHGHTHTHGTEEHTH